jgi:hypothetical protein
MHNTETEPQTLPSRQIQAHHAAVDDSLPIVGDSVCACREVALEVPAAAAAAAAAAAVDACNGSGNTQLKE